MDRVPEMAYTMSAEHECRRGRKCRTRTRTPDGQWHPGLIEHPGLCRSCEDVAFEQIRRLWTDWQCLNGAIGEKRRGTPQIGGTNERPTPLNQQALTVWENIANELSHWSAVVTGGDPLPTSIDLYVQQAHTNVTTRLGTLIDQPLRRYWTLLPLPFGGDFTGRAEWDGVDAVMRLADLHQQAQRALGASDTRIWLADPCHVCGIKSLTPSSDQETITCRNCRNVWSATKFAELQETLDYERRDVKHA